MKFFFVSLLLIFGLFTQVEANLDDVDHNELSFLAAEPLFISLGSYCEPAHMLKFCDMRKLAFPFDWIISFDGEGLINIIEDDFSHFLEWSYFTPYGPAGHLLNTYYHLEFLHDGDFNGHQFYPNMQKLITKYERRIARFRELSEYEGKVFFIRAACHSSATDPHRHYKFADNLEITDAYAYRLQEVLKKRFPKLKFSLVIVNIHERQEIKFEKQLSQDIFKFRGNPHLNQSDKIAAYRDFFARIAAIEGQQCFE